ncbi:hypothetical protein C8Q70DRAFT_659824 [Cubamyces menziesii]|nr:hypothetical protein C8Q70DRAFT_659824 [Cubamyces menziesii]
MSSLSAMSHIGALSSSGAQTGSDSNHSPTMMMSQPPPNHTAVQPNHNNGPYVSVQPQRVHTFDVIPYVPQGPPPAGGQLMYTGDTSTSQERTDAHGDDSESPSPSTANGHGHSASGKRKQPDSGIAEGGGPRKRRPRASGHENGAEAGEGESQDLDVGPNGGPKHWTEDEKSRFFTWMLTSDDHWDAFRTRMNTVFRECSNELFPGRKSYTALKSCFHRNLEVFKQIHAFQLFSANRLRQLEAEGAGAEQPSVDAMLEAARAAGLNVGTLNSKVIDRWYETGWFELFRRRYREDPKTGMLVPYYGPLDPSEAGSATAPPPHTMMNMHAPTSIDPQLVNHQSLATPHAADGVSMHQNASAESSQQSASLQNGSYSYSPPFPHTPEYRAPGPSAPYTPPAFTYLRSSNAASTRPAHRSPAESRARTPGVAASRTQSDLSASREASHPDHVVQTTQALVRLNAVADSLLEVCATLKDFIQQQAEESRVRTEAMRLEAAQRQQASEAANGSAAGKEISIEKVTFATEILKNGPENEDIKKAAIECLTKYLMRDL